MTSSDTAYLPKAPSLLAIILGVRVSMYEFEDEGTVRSIA